MYACMTYTFIEIRRRTTFQAIQMEYFTKVIRKSSQTSFGSQLIAEYGIHNIINIAHFVGPKSSVYTCIVW